MNLFSLPHGAVDGFDRATWAAFSFDLDFSPLFLGRFQRGQVVKAVLAGLSGVPDSAPSVSLCNPSTGQTLATYRMPISAADMKSFQYPVRSLPGMPLGTFSLVFSYTINGAASTVINTFDLVDGGDTGGLVISLCGYDRPEANYMLAQLDSGNLVQGRNPRL